MLSNILKILNISLVSGTNAFIISPPGWGKTTAAIEAAKASGAKTLFLPLSPATPPEKVEGGFDLAELKKGKVVRTTEGTPYDPSVQIVILDELGRANEIVFDQLVNATLDYQRPPLQRPVFWATSNFPITKERFRALVDRFGLWAEFTGDVVDVREVLVSGGVRVDSFPKWDEAIAVRSAKAGNAAMKTVISKVEELADAAVAAGFTISPRRVETWGEILLRVSIHEHRSADFNKLSPLALEALKWAWPSASAEEARKWQEVAVSVMDSVGAAIEAAFQAAAQEIARLGEAGPHETAARITALGRVLANAEETLRRVGGDDPRVESALAELAAMFSKAVTGKERM